MLTIHKYSLPVNDEIVIPMRQGRILDVQVQNGIPCMWALVDDEKPVRNRKFRMFGTGHPVTDSVRNFIGTFQLPELGLVFHLFEVA